MTNDEESGDGIVIRGYQTGGNRSEEIEINGGLAFRAVLALHTAPLRLEARRHELEDEIVENCGARAARGLTGVGNNTIMQRQPQARQNALKRGKETAAAVAQG